MDKEILKQAMSAKPDITYLGNMDEEQKEELMRADPEVLYIGKSTSGAFNIPRITFGKTVVHTLHTYSSVVAMKIASYIHELRKIDPVKAEWAKEVLGKDPRATLPRGFPAYTPFKMPQ